MDKITYDDVLDLIARMSVTKTLKDLGITDVNCQAVIWRYSSEGGTRQVPCLLTGGHKGDHQT